MRPLIDLDRPATWPAGLASAVAPLLELIAAERDANLRQQLPGEERDLDGTPTPATNEALAMVRDAMDGADLRAFHATRLRDSHDVIAEGLRPLDLRERIAAVRQALAEAGASDPLVDFDMLIERIDFGGPTVRRREGWLFAFPSQEPLHGDGCKGLFGSYGGEAIEEICGEGSHQLRQALSTIGYPAVVTIRIPAFGVCEAAASELPQCMVDLMLRSADLLDTQPRFWDVKMRRGVPAAWVESVHPYHGPSASA